MIGSCYGHWRELTALPAGLFQLVALKQLTLSSLSKLQAMPDASGLTSLEILTIDACDALTALPAGLEQLGALKQLTLSFMSGLEVSETFGRMTALERLTLSDCYKLKTLPVSIMHLSQLRELRSEGCPLQDMPCIDALTALRTLALGVADYTHSSRTFTALSRSLPCLQQLDVLNLTGLAPEPDQNGSRNPVALRAEDVLAVGRALRAWPLPLLHDVQDDDVQRGIRLSTCWQALGLPAAAADWSNATTLEFFRVQQHKVVAFASGMHVRLGAASRVSRLDEQTLVMIVEEVLGGWALLKEWQQQEWAGEGGGARG